MGRPSLKNQRRQQILTATKSLAARHGLGGLTLESIAKEAGMARPLVRHNIGNRDEIILALVDDLIKTSNGYIEEYKEHLSDEHPMSDLLAMLFDPQYSDSEFVRLANFLLMEGENQPVTGKVLAQWTTDFIDFIYETGIKQYPKTEKKRVMDTAIGICGIYFSVESMLVSGEIAGFREGSFRCAQFLMERLES